MSWGKKGRLRKKGGGRVEGERRWDVGGRMIADGVLYVFCWRMQQRRGVGARLAPIRRQLHRLQPYSATARTIRPFVRASLYQRRVE
jgi:hypothetical protein